MKKNNINALKFSLITSFMIALAVMYFAGGILGMGILNSLEGNLTFYQYNNIVLTVGILISIFYYSLNKEKVGKINLAKFYGSYSLIIYMNFLVLNIKGW